MSELFPKEKDLEAKGDTLLISVIIPIYNAARYIARCLDSILIQTYTNLEILCVNDGSQDDVELILQEYALNDDRIKIINKEHGGVSSAKNAGIDAAMGNYVGFVDADDYIDRNYYEIMLRKAIEGNADIVIVPTKFFNSEGVRSILRPFYEFNVLRFCDKVDQFRGGSVADKIFRRNLLDKYAIRFDVGHTWEGNLFLLKAAFYSEIMASSIDTFYNYTYNINSVSRPSGRKSTEQRIVDRLFVCQAISDWIREKGISGKDFMSAMGLVKRSVINDGFYRRYRWRVWKKFGIHRMAVWHMMIILKKFKQILRKIISVFSLIF